MGRAPSLLLSISCTIFFCGKVTFDHDIQQCIMRPSTASLDMQQTSAYFTGNKKTPQKENIVSRFQSPIAPNQKLTSLAVETPLQYCSKFDLNFENCTSNTYKVNCISYLAIQSQVMLNFTIVICAEVHIIRLINFLFIYIPKR